MKLTFKKSIVGLLTVATMLTPVFASATQENGGSETIGGAAKTGITSGAKDGGYWVRGKVEGKLKSSYKHYTQHGFASVTNGKGVYADGGWQNPDAFSNAKLITWTFSGTNKSNYRFK